MSLSAGDNVDVAAPNDEARWTGKNDIEDPMIARRLLPARFSTGLNLTPVTLVVIKTSDSEKKNRRFSYAALPVVTCTVLSAASVSGSKKLPHIHWPHFTLK